MAVDGARVAAFLDTVDLFDRLYPENYDEERDRFMDAVADGERYTPRYRYPGFDRPPADTVLAEMREQAADALDRRLLAHLESRLEMVAAIGSSDITETSAAHYGQPDDALVAAAKAAYRAPGGTGDGGVSSDALRDAYGRLFDALGMEYRCRLVDAETIRHEAAEQAILLPRGKEYGRTQAKRILIHESTHAVRAYNGMRHGHPALVYGTAGYETVEEGLTAVNEDAVGVFEDTLPRLTSRVLAVAQAGKPFPALYEAMRDLGMDRDTAFVRTYRVKRGLQDTAAAGGFIKDHIYFQGYRRLQDLSAADIGALYVGKVDMDAVDDVDGDPAVTRDEHLAAYRTAVDVLEPS